MICSLFNKYNILIFRYYFLMYYIILYFWLTYELVYLYNKKIVEQKIKRKFWQILNFHSLLANKSSERYKNNNYLQPRFYRHATPAYIMDDTNLTLQVFYFFLLFFLFRRSSRFLFCFWCSFRFTSCFGCRFSCCLFGLLERKWSFQLTLKLKYL